MFLFCSLVRNFVLLKVTITHFEKPSYTYFTAHKKTATSTHSIFHITQIQDYDSFWFLSLLPNENMSYKVRNKKMFNIIITTSFFSLIQYMFSQLRP